ncbi:MAG: transcriptional repressor [Betaproteobacteria bacterium]|jgi:Fur family iron response transcriptional regulator|nr:transcriptional repressor [Betaproteobacteria bacterium]NBR98023.1 transcriptional repressor [Betaproteobacteria bacterium]NBS92292.1 transcriptional repressor [Betaproteobacteria bacterium]NBY52734.1 transcriptional repressor [Betaproteobacteria bacterium]NCA24524.1 transcriptional repressor [Betaproteobacteria bacterium]
MNGPLISPDALTGLLRSIGVNTTSPRLRIAELIMTRREHLSAEQVFTVINQSRPRISRATVYNTLNLFVDRGLLQTVTSRAGVTLYDPNTEPHLHIHDIDSDTLHDIPLDMLQGFPLERIARGFKVERIDLTLRVRRSESPAEAA